MDDAAVRSPAGTAPTALLPEEQAWLGLPSVLPASTQLQLVRMFRDQHLPGNEERAELIAHLREAIALTPQVPELRVMLGIVLCLTPQAPGGCEELREAARNARYNFDARLRLGDLLMRLCICDQAAEQTRIALELATDTLQSDLARRQAATIRAAQRNGMPHRGSGKVSAFFGRVRRRG